MLSRSCSVTQVCTFTSGDKATTPCVFTPSKFASQEVHACQVGVDGGTLRHRVDVLVAEIQYFYETKTPFRIYHGTTHSTHPLAFHRDSILDTSHLSHVVRVDRFRKKALVEPNVSMEQLVDLTLQSGLIPQVTMDFLGNGTRVTASATENPDLFEGSAGTFGARLVSSRYWKWSLSRPRSLWS